MYPTCIGSEPSAADFDSQPLWEKVMTGHAVANGVFIAAVNRVGFEGTVTLYGSSFAVNPKGEVIAKASRDQPEVLVVDLDFEVFDICRKLFPLLTQRQPQTYSRLLSE